MKVRQERTSGAQARLSVLGMLGKTAKSLPELEAQRRSTLHTLFCASGAGVLLLSAAVRSVAERRLASTFAVSALVALLLTLAPFARSLSVRLADVLACVAVIVAVPITLAQSGGLNAGGVVFVPLIPIVMVGFLGGRSALMVGAALVLAVAGGLLVAGHVPTPEAAHPEAFRALYASMGIVVAVTIGYIHDRERQNLERRLAENMQCLYQLSVRDALTNLYNRGYLNERLVAERAYAQRHSTELSVLLLDVDHFKRINDSLGHGAGDDVLIELAKRLTAALRKEDCLARYGGEEFAILLRGEAIESASLVGERLRRAVCVSPFRSADQEFPVTISVGCASLACCAGAALLDVADERLYAAKHAGRNRVVARVA